MEKKLTRRQALKTAGAVALGSLASSTIGIPRVALAHEEEAEPWEDYIDVKIEIEMGSMYFQVEGQEKNAPITLEVGKIYLLEFKNVNADLHHNALFGKDPDLDKRNYKVLLIDNFYGIELEGGQQGEIVLKAPDKPGDWEVGCFVSGHYEAGMKAPIKVVK